MVQRSDVVVQRSGGCGNSYSFELWFVFQVSVASHDVYPRCLEILLHLVWEDGHTRTAPLKWIEIVEKALDRGQREERGGRKEREERGKGRRGREGGKREKGGRREGGEWEERVGEKRGEGREGREERERWYEEDK